MRREEAIQTMLIHRRRNCQQMTASRERSGDGDDRRAAPVQVPRRGERKPNADHALVFRRFGERNAQRSYFRRIDDHAERTLVNVLPIDTHGDAARLRRARRLRHN